MSMSIALFSGLRRFSTVPGGSFAKASSVGAKTVNGPFPLRVSTRPAAVRAAVRVLKEPALTAVSTIFFSSAAFRDAPEKAAILRANASFFINDFILYYNCCNYIFLYNYISKLLFMTIKLIIKKKKIILKIII
jgi:hypothetical protein